MAGLPSCSTETLFCARAFSVTERNDLRPDHCKLWGNYTRERGGDFICITRGVSHCGLAIYILKYLKAKEELWKLLNYFTMQKYNLQKIL